jgi:tetratricopeptide (TPR) repeat protein
LAGIFFPDSSKNIIEKTLILKKMTDAKNLQYAGDYKGALSAYREVIVQDKNNAAAYYRAAECYYELLNYNACLEYLNKSLELDPKVNSESDYLIGKVNHRLLKLDEAIAAFEKFKAANASNPVKLKDYMVDEYIAQCKRAKEMVANPVKANITNIALINSRNYDYAAFETADGKILYFGSRRPQSTGGIVSTADSKYFEDIYYCTRNEDGTWSEPRQVEGKLNTDEHDLVSHVTADGSTIYITQNISRYTKSSDIAVAKLSKSTDKWGMAKLLPKGKKAINTSFFDGCPTLTSDEKTIYFVSERGGEKNGADIYKSNKLGSNKWSEPMPVTELNTPMQETTPFIYKDKYLFFSSEGHGSMGGYDIYYSKFEGGVWTAPKNLGYPVNSVNHDIYFRLSADGKKGYLSSIREDGKGEFDIYEIDFSQTEAEWLKE